MTDMTELQAVHRVPKAIGVQKLKVVASSSIVPPAPPGLLGTNCLVRFAPQTRLVILLMNALLKLILFGNKRFEARAQLCEQSSKSGWSANDEALKPAL